MTVTVYIVLEHLAIICNRDVAAICCCAISGWGFRPNFPFRWENLGFL